MTLATVKGRIQTKLITFILLGGIAALFAWHGGNGYIQLFAIALVVGIILETFWGWFIVHQPGWLSFVLAGVEFGLITFMAFQLTVPVTLQSAFTFYFTAWVVIQLFLVYILPIWRLNWADKGSELW